MSLPAMGSVMELSVLTRRWGLFAAITFVLIGLMLANPRAGPVGDLGGATRYAFWLATAAAAFGCWWLSQVLVVSGRELRIAARGDDEPERLSRLRWLDSRLAQADTLVRPYTAVVVTGRTLSVLGRSFELADSGFPVSIRSRFTPDVTSAGGPPRELLAGPVTLTAVGPDGRPLAWTHALAVPHRVAEGSATWSATNRAGALTAETRAKLEFDGTIESTVALRADEAIDLADVRLELPLREVAARYAMGLGPCWMMRPERWIAF